MDATIKTVVAFGYSVNGCCDQIHPLAILMEIVFIPWRSSIVVIHSTIFDTTIRANYIDMYRFQSQASVIE